MDRRGIHGAWTRAHPHHQEGHAARPRRWVPLFEEEDVKDSDMTSLVSYILDDNKSCHIDGRAGCGKSYLIKELQNKMK